MRTMTAPRTTRSTRPTRHALLVCLLGVSVAACESPLADQVGSESQPIIGGQVDIGDPAVLYLSGVEGLCTGTLVADTVVLTAGHCLPQQTVYFGNQVGEFTDSRRVVNQIYSRNFDPDNEDLNNWGGDIALLRLEEPAPPEVEPIPINTDHLDESYAGAQVRTVGFGVTDGATQTGGGTKRFVYQELLGLTLGEIITGTETANTCQGDSGGPTFLDFDGTERVIAVTSWGYGGCLAESRQTRTDVYYDAFLEEVIDAWSGPCQQDNNCVTEGCRTPDPDCDICGFDGFCGTGCEKKDLDCPLGAAQGETCSNREDCETLLCLESPEDPRVKYCSTECDPDNLDNFWSCQTPLSECLPEGDGTSYCRFAGLTPGVQGSECTEGADCRSSICYPSDGGSICAEPCGGGEPECPAPYSCEDVGGASLCILPSDGGGCCQASGAESGRTTAGTLLLAGLTFLLFAGGWRRRRRTASSR